MQLKADCSVRRMQAVKCEAALRRLRDSHGRSPDRWKNHFILSSTQSGCKHKIKRQLKRRPRCRDLRDSEGRSFERIGLVCCHLNPLKANRSVKTSVCALKMECTCASIILLTSFSWRGLITCIFPRTPVLSIRLATFTVFPQMSYCGFWAPMTPAITGPWLIPDNGQQYVSKTWCLLLVNCILVINAGFVINFKVSKWLSFKKDVS